MTRDGPRQERVAPEPLAILAAPWTWTRAQALTLAWRHGGCATWSEHTAPRRARSSVDVASSPWRPRGYYGLQRDSPGCRGVRGSIRGR